MSSKIYKVPEDFAALAHLKHADYLRLYQESVRDPHAFWSRIGRRLDWVQPYSKVKDTSFDEQDFRIRWFYDGKLNVAANCLDRHLTKRGDKTAILWEGDDPRLSERITYRQLYERVCQCANALKALGVRKGDRVTIYMPMIPETAVAMLACTRIGAVHSVVFGGFSPESLAGRIADCSSSVVITADEGLRGGKRIPLKANVDAALAAPGTRVREACARRAPPRLAACRCRQDATAGSKMRSQVSRRNVRPRSWTRRIRCSSCTPPAPPANPRACCTRPAATWCTRR